MKELWAAFEGGGTKTRVLLSDTNGKVLDRQVGGTSSSLYIQPTDYETYVESTRSLLEQIKAVAGREGGRVSTVGLAAPMVPALVAGLFREIFGPVRFVYSREADIGRALYDLRWGVTMVAGTGASCVAVDETGAGAVCGGFGPQFGDEGSGYWIGREAISAVMRAMDGRGLETALTERLEDFYGLGNIFEIYRFRDHSGHVSGPKVASCVPEVFRAAREGDAVASGVCRAAGHALGHTIVATCRRAGFSRETIIPIVLTGGVYHGGPLIIGPLKRVLRRSKKMFKVYPEITEPAEGIFKIIKQHVEEDEHGLS